jgi:hypothetical protein
LPLPVGLELVVGDEEGDVIVWSDGAVQQSHTSLLWGSTRFAAIAWYTGADYIFPRVFTTLVAWDDMVDGELVSFLAAILADIVVAVENLKAGQLSLGVRALDYIA